VSYPLVETDKGANTLLSVGTSAFFQERELIFIDSDTQSLIPCSAKGRVVHPKQRNRLFPPCVLALVKFGHKKCFGSEKRRLVWDI